MLLVFGLDLNSWSLLILIIQFSKAQAAVQHTNDQLINIEREKEDLLREIEDLRVCFQLFNIYFSSLKKSTQFATATGKLLQVYITLVQI